MAYQIPPLTYGATMPYTYGGVPITPAETQLGLQQGIGTPLGADSYTAGLPMSTSEAYQSLAPQADSMAASQAEAALLDDDGDDGDDGG